MTSLYKKKRFDYLHLIGGAEKSPDQPPAYQCPHPPQMNLQSLDSFLPQMFEHQIQIKMLHFQTKRFGWNKALDDYLDKFNQNFDRLMESAQGVTQTRLNAQNININVQMLQDNMTSINELNNFMIILQHNISNCTQDLGLLAIRDEMVAELNKLIYLLSFQ